MHSKAIYVDKKYLFLWSINFSHYSIDRNREIWIILKNSKILSDFEKIFNNDFKQNITEK
jgi:phosphatidylserine/phosphatidylglycerophosphate/cardiolipin synthase-like enzyme